MSHAFRPVSPDTASPPPNSATRPSPANLGSNRASPSRALTIVRKRSASSLPEDAVLAEINPLAKYSVVDALDELQENLAEKQVILGDLVLSGQATVFYAMPNTGKTLITLRLVIDAIKSGLFDPQKLNYLNLDDDAAGLVEKSRLAEVHGFHMMAPGFKGFSVTEFFLSMREMAASNTAKGIIVVVDTLTKIVDPMDKKAARELAEIVGEFKLKGGTFLALGHTNKRLDRRGKVVYAGASDIVDSFDSVWTIQEVDERLERDQKVVLFENQKGRGTRVLKAAYGYSVEPNASYLDKLASVHKVASDDCESLRQVVHLTQDAPVIAAIEEGIRQGKTQKVELATSAAVAANVNFRQTMRVLEKYSGTDSRFHHWTSARVFRGAYEFRLLEPTSVPSVRSS